MTEEKTWFHFLEYSQPLKTSASWLWIVCSGDWALSRISHCWIIRGLLPHLCLTHTGLPAAWWAQQVIVERNSTSLMIALFEGEGKTCLLCRIFFQFIVYLSKNLENFGMPTATAEKYCGLKLTQAQVFKWSENFASSICSPPSY